LKYKEIDEMPVLNQLIEPINNAIIKDSFVSQFAQLFKTAISSRDGAFHSHYSSATLTLFFEVLAESDSSPQPDKIDFKIDTYFCIVAPFLQGFIQSNLRQQDEYLLHSFLKTHNMATKNSNEEIGTIFFELPFFKENKLLEYQIYLEKRFNSKFNKSSSNCYVSYS
jgi:hypothetical protein